MLSGFWVFFFIYQDWKVSDKRATSTKVQKVCPDVQVFTPVMVQLFQMLSVGCCPDGQHPRRARTALPEGNKFICHFFYRLCCSQQRKWPLTGCASLRPSVGRLVWPVWLHLWLHRNVALDLAKVHKQSRVGSSPCTDKWAKKLFAKIRGALWPATLKCHVTPAMRLCVSVVVHLNCAPLLSAKVSHLSRI